MKTIITILLITILALAIIGMASIATVGLNYIAFHKLPLCNLTLFSWLLLITSTIGATAMFAWILFHIASLKKK